jgi:hypothetical protein
MRLDLLAQVLADASLGAIGTSIFVYRMNADCKQGIMLREPLIGVPVDPNLPNYFKHNVQVIVRAPDQATGDALAKNAMKALTFYNRMFFDGDNNLQMQVNHLFPKILPVVYPRLDGQGIEWSVDMDANYVMPV